MIKWIWTYKFSIICFIAIVRLTCYAFPSVGDEASWLPFADKWVHAGMFGTLALFILWECSHKLKRNIAFRSIVLGCSFVLAFGGMIELYQKYFTTDRSGDWFDFLADSVGVLIVFVFFTVMQNKKRE